MENPANDLRADIDVRDNKNNNKNNNNSDNNTKHIGLDDEFYMREALKVAKNALKLGEVPVGCVIVLCEHTSVPAGESVVISHGANQVNATRDATRHAEIVAIDRLLTHGASSDELRLPPDVGTKPPPGGLEVPQPVRQARTEQWEDRLVNAPDQPDHWKNSFGWRNEKNNSLPELSSMDIFKHCHLFVTCEPCIMCAAALATVGIRRVVFGCKNDRFGGCGSLLHLYEKEEESVDDGTGSSCHATTASGYEITSGVLESDAITVLRSFYDRENFHAPDSKRKRKEDSNGS